MIFPISALVTFGGEEVADILQAFVKEEGNASVLTPEQKAAIATVVEICQDGEFRSMSVEFEAVPGRPGAARPISKKTCIALIVLLHKFPEMVRRHIHRYIF